MEGRNEAPSILICHRKRTRDSSMVELTGQQTGSVVDKFVARRGEARVNKGVEKKVAFRIKGTSAL
jgi:hypothetical protein